MLRTIGLCGVSAAIVFASVSCSSDKGTSSSTTTASESVTTASNVVQALESAGNFTVLLEVLKSQGLSDVLSGSGPFTVFAPNDKAFNDAAAKLGTSIAVLTTALAAEPALLTDMLRYHVVSGDYPNSKLLSLNGQLLKTLSGESFTVNVEGTTISFTDGFDQRLDEVGNEIIASNGVIHVLDGVLEGALPGVG
jgi:uncharacterized surface protein with fasciclin (FAS1) repeats